MLETRTKRLSISKVLWTDDPAFIYTGFAVAAWIVYIAWTPGWREDRPFIDPE